MRASRHVGEASHCEGAGGLHERPEAPRRCDHVRRRDRAPGPGPAAPPARACAGWDPRPIAAASIGQVHRAVTLDGRAVAVKVQYPGIAETIAADLRNVALLRRMLRITAPAQDVDALLTELRDRVGEELDYRREAANQPLMAAYYHGHPTTHVPGVISERSTHRIVSTELSC